MLLTFSDGTIATENAASLSFTDDEKCGYFVALNSSVSYPEADQSVSTLSLFFLVLLFHGP